MLRSILFFVIILTTINYASEIQKKFNLIPYPQSVEMKAGNFVFTSDTKISIPNSSNNFQQYLTDIILKLTEIKPGFITAEKLPAKNFILFNLNNNLGEEEYTIDCNSNRILINSGSSKGLFYASQTLIQLLTTDIQKNRSIIPSIFIKDKPGFEWRGLNMDCSRHFMTKDFILRYIDLLAFYKLNRLHLHLVDDQGWRIEIKKYPKLTSVGAWRKEPDGTIYGGFYTQEELKEIVAYANDRFITVVPEIEMPGHSQASLAAYPENSCTGGPFEVGTMWGVMTDVYCAGNDNVFGFLQDVLSEVMTIFPSEYIHIGGDEVPKDKWSECEKCQARIKNEGLKNENELQSYFIKRIEKFLNANGKKLVGWDEILEGGLAPQAIVQSWRGYEGAVEAARSQHFTIVSPQSYTYFNAAVENTTIDKVYSFNPIPNELTEDEAKYILGSEANIWTEYAPQETIDSKLFPRITALAEVLWLEKSKQNFASYNNRLQNHYKILTKLGVDFGLERNAVQFVYSFNSTKNAYDVTIKPGQPGFDLRFTTDGSDPEFSSLKFTNPLKINKSTKIKVSAFKEKKKVGYADSLQFTFHKGLNKQVKITNQYSEEYKANGIAALTDGLRGSSKYLDGFWQGYEGVDVEILIDIEKPEMISTLSSGYLQDAPSWIFMPEYVEYQTSVDGKNYNQAGIVKNEISQKYPNPIHKDFILQITPVKARYIKIKAKGTINTPAWLSGAGGKSWVFIDEVVIN